jgi:C-terminal peptidase prc
MNKSKTSSVLQFLLCAVVAVSGCSRKPDVISQVASVFAENSAYKISAEQVESVLKRDGKDGLPQLDKYCALVGTTEKRLAIMTTSNHTVGVGMMILDRDGYLVVGKVIDGAPAAQSGIKEGDRIINVNDKSVVGMHLPDARKLMSQNPTQVKMTIEHSEGQRAQRFDVILKPVPFEFPTVSSTLLPGGIGYLRIMSLPVGISDKVKNEMDKLVAAGSKKIIVDLRYNSNGELSELPGLLKLFVGDGKTLFSEQSDKPAYSAVYKADAQAPYSAMQYAVIVNTQTVAGAEIVAASLHENASAPVIGVKTPGQVGVQHMFTLSDGRGLKITVALMTPPSGKQLDGQGLLPDAAVIAGEQQEELLKKEWFFSPGKILPGDQYVSQAVEALAGKGK